MASGSPLRWLDRPGRFEPPPGHTVSRARLAKEAVGRRTSRPVGRIGGAAWVDRGGAPLGCLADALGPDSQLLGVDGRGATVLGPGMDDRHCGDAPVVVDWDACWIDERPITSTRDWVGVLEADRLAEVEGAFAIAWWGRDGVVHLARDAPGERTLYYAPTGAGVLFASSLGALLATGLVHRAIDVISLAAYLSCAYVPGRRTLVEGIFEVLPGERIDIAPDRIGRQVYWALKGDRDNHLAPASSEDAQVRLLRTVLERAVARRLPCGGPVAATLSGGIDSSAVVAIARQLHDGPVRTYAASFGPRYPNELAYSSMVATHCGATHRIVEMSPRLVLRNLDDVVSLLSKPIGDPLTVPNALLFREASQEAAVVLNGEGGDPCFGGPKNLPVLLALLYREASAARDDLWWERTYLRVHQKAYDDIGAALVPEAAAALAGGALEESLRPHFEDARWTTLVNRLMAMNVALKGSSHILLKLDQISAAYGVLARSPLFDRSVVELSLSLPPQMKLRGSNEKHVLKRAVANLLPPAIIDRPKSGMRVPVEAWFEGPLRRHARERLLDGLAPHGLIRSEYLTGLLSEGQPGYRLHRGVKIWLLVTLEAWLRTVYAVGVPSRPLYRHAVGKSPSRGS